MAGLHDRMESMGGNGWVVGPHGGKRKPYRKVPMAVLATRITESDKAALDRLASLTGRTVGDVVREACRIYILTQERVIKQAESEWEEGRGVADTDSV